VGAGQKTAAEVEFPLSPGNTANNMSTTPKTAQLAAGPPTFDLSRFVRDHEAPAVGLLVLLCVAVLWPYRHFAGDDAYITFRFAHNVATGGGFAFNPGVPTYGSTAPLWVFLIVGMSRLGLDIPAAAHLLNWVFAIADVLLFFRLASRYLGKGAAAWIATALLIVDPWFVRWALSGMENAFALCLLMGVLLCQLHYRNSGRLSWVAPILAALAGLCRPEMVLLSGLLALDMLLLERRRLLANLVAAVASYTVIFIPWFWYATVVFHSPIPNTITAKISADHGLALWRVLLYFGSFWVFEALAVVAVLLIKPLRQAALGRFPSEGSAWLLPIAWAVILPAFYIVGGAPVAGRYMMFGLPCYLLIGVAAWSVLWDRFPKLIVAAAFATLALVIGVQYKYSWYITRWPQGMDPRMIDAAVTLESISRSTDVVAGDQIGVLGYFSQRPVLDTYGLASPEILPYKKTSEQAVWKYVHERHVQYLFVINSIEDLTRMDPAYASLTLVRPVQVQREGANAAAGPIQYYLYKTNW
jgi:hypothetical protein